MGGDVELGLYGSAYTIFEIILMFFPAIIMSASFPVLSKQYKNNIKEMKRLCNVLLKYFLFFGIPMSCGLVLLGDETIIALFSKEYKDAGLLLSILGFTVWICFLTYLTSWILTAIEKQSLVLISAVIAMIINIILNIYMIPLYGAKGAALTTLFCEFVQFVFMFIMFKRSISIKYNVKLFRILIASTAMCITVMLTKNALIEFNVIVSLILIILVAVIIYLGISYVLKIIKIKELKLLIQ